MAVRLAPRTIPLALLMLLGCSAASPRPTSAPPAQGASAAPAAATGERARAAEPLFPGARHSPAIPSPELVLGTPLGSRPARHAELLEALRALEGASERLSLEEIGRTHEGRPLVIAVIAAPERRARLDAIRADLARLGDPRGLSEGEAARLARETPAVAWIGCSIHGDETSGSDMGLALAWHLAADESEATRALLEELVVVIDPCMNPDGRERILSLFAASAGRVPNLDFDGLHRGRWPYGRGNHYLFDLNRDWIWGTQPETRARWAALARWNPQLVVDAHEMGPLDSYLFYPARDPINPHYPAEPRSWWARFSADQAEAFDAHGWSYYTREWAEGWYIGYSDSWAGLRGAVGILYEQARLAGQDLRRPTGEVVTYREAVRRQIVSALANLGTLAANRAAVLADYAAARAGSLDEGGARAFVLAPGRSPSREAELVRALLAQGLELERAEEAFAVTGWRDALGRTADERRFEAGALIARAAQPLGALLRGALELDPRMDEASLRREREKLERERRSEIFDVTAWSPAQAYDLDAGFGELGAARTSRVVSWPEPETGLAPGSAERAPYGWIVDGGDDRSLAFAAQALEEGLALHVAEEDFRAAGRSFARGSLLLRRVENERAFESSSGDELAATIERVARAAGVLAVATASGRSPDDGPDLGGGRFHLLARPRLALLANEPVAAADFGHVWHLCDERLGLPVTQMDAQELGSYDLRRYDVLVLPPARPALLALLRERRAELVAWIESGGSLIALGTSAAIVADPGLELCATRSREDALESLEAHAEGVARERRARNVVLDAEALWENGDAPGEVLEPEERSTAELLVLRRRDEWLRVFMPAGAFLRGEVDQRHWITAGLRAELPVLASGPHAFLATWPVEVPVRLATRERLRLAGLLWPEARERLADTAWLTLERRGHGQIVLFADSPAFRGWTLGAQRLLANALVLGPSLGASRPLPR